MKWFWMTMILVSAGALWAQEHGSEDYRTLIYGSSFGTTSRVILNQEDIRKSKAPNISALLATQANISVISTSFQPGAIYMRGGDASHLLILVDGLPFYDPSTLNKTVNINQIDIKSIRRIEISKGAQTVLYGGQALVGVIRIDTFPKDARDQTQAVVEAGEREYRKVSAATVRDLQEGRAVVARVQASEKQNRSPVLGSNVDYPTKTMGGDLGYLHSQDWDFFVKASGLKDRTNVANSNFMDFRAVDATDFETRTDLSSVMGGFRAKKQALRPQLLAGFQHSDKRYLFPSNPAAAGGPQDDRFASDLFNLRFEAIPWDRESGQVTAGLSYSKETLVQRDITDVEAANVWTESKGLFLKGQFELQEDLDVEAGLRGDVIQNQNQVQSYQLGFIYRKNWKLEYATGYKSPSLSQLFGNGANPDLLPERSRTLTMDYSHSFSEQQKASITVFESLFDNLIIYQTKAPPATSQNVNVARAVTRGVELQYGVDFSTETNLRLNLGYQEPWDVQNARWLTRRPLQTGSLSVAQAWNRDRFQYEVIGNGERIDRFSLTQYGSLDAYLISNASWTHAFSDQFSTYLRGDNIWNHRVEESRGYFSEGAFWLVGLEFSN